MLNVMVSGMRKQTPGGFWWYYGSEDGDFPEVTVVPAILRSSPPLLLLFIGGSVREGVEAEAAMALVCEKD